MAAVVASKPPIATPKMKKPSLPSVQTNVNGVKPPQPLSSPSLANQKIPGPSQPLSAISASPVTINGVARPKRGLQRLTTRNSVIDGSGMDRKTNKKYPEPYVAKDSHILKKFRGYPPSLIVHLHPTNFRFDQQDGSFSYHSEMRIFIEHLQKGTIPHDMVEEFRKADVQYYDGWLIVRVIDHRSAANAAAASGAGSDDGKPFSIHNYNHFITPSPYAPYPTKEQQGVKSPPMKPESRDGSTKPEQAPSSDAPSETVLEVVTRNGKPQPKIFHVALRPTILSRHMDLVIDAMAPDPKQLTRKQSQAGVSGRNPGAGAPTTPIGGIPVPPAAEKGPPFKKQKTKIDPKSLLDYEARVVNATAPPLYLEAVDSLAEVESLISMLKDDLHDAAPPSPKSRKRTVAELAADDAHAKEQERFMLIMDERNLGGTNAGNAAAVDGQAGAALFQPRFEKFNALDNIKREITERKQREKERQQQEEENRRVAQEQLQEEDKKRMMQQRVYEARLKQQREQQEMQVNMLARRHKMQQQQLLQAGAKPQGQQMAAIPPNIQSQMINAQARSSPIIRQGTPQNASSPIVNSATTQSGLPMATSNSQQGHGTPPRPGSALQNGNPGVAMARHPSAGGPSRNGTPQISTSTPGMRNATPVMRQGTPAQNMSQASPSASMVVSTPQMNQAALMAGQMPNGMARQPLNAQQAAEMQRRHMMQQQAAALQMSNGTPQMSQAQIAHLQAQHHAQADRQAAIQRHQQAQQQAQQQAIQQAQQQQQGTPQQQMAQSPAQNQNAYKQSVAEQMKAQMHNLQQQTPHQNSPAQTHMTPQQQAAQMAQQQQQQQRLMQQVQQQGQMLGNVNGAHAQNPQQQQQQQQQQPQQQQRPMNPALQQLYTNTLQAYTQRYTAQAAAKYGGNTSMLQPAEIQQIHIQAKQATVTQVRRRQAEMNQQQMHQAQMRQQVQQMGGMPNGMNMNMNPNMAAALQQQQAQQMQQFQMQQAQAQMQQAAQNQMLAQQQGGMAGMHQYQQQLANMQQQQQGQR